ncbi:RNA polymerase ii subunit a c-terminal domain phosphatase [Anaeramoeba ignava]|uniref:RNA polymerase II subunit A C-terminal domain phosphatase SSU72 n=1 Tax=Anaeramoeba ignava TaxID=1746090 RepID=A0A9Q0LCB4_ANAIG|nr:RNA polymerase ii subunit a c-terminal domain phosphatase [Anaeramoeba ignava]
MSFNFKQIPIALVCARNMNRSMESHSLLKIHGYNIESYGTSSVVKLPSPSGFDSNIYDFNTPYLEIAEDLKKKDFKFYSQSGVLELLERNHLIKSTPQKFQDSKKFFPLIITFEIRVYDEVVKHLEQNSTNSVIPIYVINFETVDTNEEAFISSQLVLKLIQQIENNGSQWEENLEIIIDNFQKETSRKITFNILFF